MKNHGNNVPAQTFQEMIETGSEQKKQSKLYKVESSQFVDERLSALVAKTASELAEAAESEPVSLKDADAVKHRTILYLKSCEATSTFPSVAGLARSMGLSRQALYDCVWRKAPPETARWLELFRDSCSDMLAEASLRNDCNNITAIFLQKSLYGLRETVEVIAKADEPLGNVPDQRALEERIAGSVVVDDWQ